MRAFRLLLLELPRHITEPAQDLRLIEIANIVISSTAEGNCSTPLLGHPLRLAELICMPMVIHDRNRGGVSASTNGSEDKVVFLPFKAGVDVYHPAGGKWAAITMPKWLRKNRKLLSPEFRSSLPPAKPGPTANHPDYEAYRRTEDGERSAINEHVRWQSEKLQPVTCFTRKSYGGSTW